jgi:Zn-dependent peptidase ImmA (M78 family)
MTNKGAGYIRKMARNVLAEYFHNSCEAIKPIPIEDIAKRNDIEIYYLEELGGNHKALKHTQGDGRVIIGINKSYHIHSQRFSIGHELGHHFLGHPPESKCSEEEIKSYNQEADEFSAELLMPLSEVKKALKSRPVDIDGIAKKFCVSREALIIKIKNSNLLRLI